MFRKFLCKIGLSLLILGNAALAYADNSSIVGKWLTIDDETNKPRSILQIWEENGEYKGQIKHIYYREDEPRHGLCEKCPGHWHNQPMIGMIILWQLVKNPENPEQWIKGRILDPKTGDIYHCQMTLKDPGKTLDARGYIGMPLLGRTQKWIRQE